MLQGFFLLNESPFRCTARAAGGLCVACRVFHPGTHTPRGRRIELPVSGTVNPGNFRLTGTFFAGG